MRSYISKILTYFEIDINSFAVLANHSNRKHKSEKEKVLPSKDIVLITDNSKRCPICYNELKHTSKEYLLYTDESKQEVLKPQKTYTKICDNCKKEFITRDTYLTLQKQKINFDNRINFVVKEIDK